MIKATAKICKMCDKPAAIGRAIYCSTDCYQRYMHEYNKGRWDSFSPERKRATGLVSTAILRGDLKRQPCEVCGHGSYVQAHHDDYAAPLDVRWLCLSHHRQHHLKFGAGKNDFITGEQIT